MQSNLARQKRSVMKKLLFSLLALLLVFGSNPSIAQNKTNNKKEAQKLKSDGTPDMRYKENQEAAKANANKDHHKTNLKKDGTPDMRYKENNAAAGKKVEEKKNLKKDGTPDKRFSENKKK